MDSQIDNLDDESKKALGPEHLGRFSRFLKEERAKNTERENRLVDQITKRVGCLFWVVMIVGVGIGLLLATVIL